MIHSSEYYLQMLESLPALIWASGPDAKCQYFNKSWLEFTGRSLEQELGDGWAHGIHPGDFERCIQVYLDAFHARVPFDMEYRLRHHDGSYRWILDEARPITDAAGDFQGYLGYGYDITERKLANEAFKQSDARFQTLARISTAGIFRTDSDAHCFYVNPRWAHITGQPTEEAMGRGWLSILHPEDRTLTLEKLNDSFRLREELNHECKILGADDEVIWILLQGRPEQDEHGVLRSYVGTATDITAHRRCAEDRLKISKIDSLGVLAGGIAHDFNNLLTPILLNLSVARNQLPADPSLEDLQDRMDEAEQAAYRARNLTRQLLTFAKGGAPLVKPVYVQDILEEAVHFALHGSRIQASLSLDDALWPAKVDVGQISQAIQHIVVNAAQSMENGGNVWIKALNVQDLDHPSLPRLDGKYVCIEIEDEGSGIRQEDLTKIFEPYFSTRTQGNGLGLATAQSIIRKHSGHLHVESELGRGSIFYIYLPAIGELDRSVSTSCGTPASGNGRVLVMDDEELVRNSMAAMLTSLGYSVETARDGTEALEIYQEARSEGNPIDIVLMDLTVQGGMGGKEAVEEIKAIDPDAKAVLCSGFSNDPIMADFKDHGFEGAIQKPFRPDDLHALLTELING